MAELREGKILNACTGLLGLDIFTAKHEKGERKRKRGEEGEKRRGGRGEEERRDRGRGEEGEGRRRGGRGKLVKHKEGKGFCNTCRNWTNYSFCLS